MVLSEYGKHVKKKTPTAESGSASAGKSNYTRLNGNFIKFTNIDLT